MVMEAVCLRYQEAEREAQEKAEKKRKADEWKSDFSELRSAGHG